MHIVLFQPEIPQNTGNIARTCAATGTRLSLIEPLGFEITEKRVKRAGLDYWPLLDIKIYRDFSELLAEFPHARYFFTSTKAKRNYAQIEYDRDDILVFGPETRGLPESLIDTNINKAIRIPMLKEARSLNLSNAVAIVLYEALRQQNFLNLRSEGELSGREDRLEQWMTSF